MKKEYKYFISFTHGNGYFGNIDAFGFIDKITSENIEHSFKMIEKWLKKRGRYDVIITNFILLD